MAAPTVLDLVPGQLETVRTELEKMFEQSDQIAGMVKKSAKPQKISRYLWRLPLKLFQGGHRQKATANAGSIGIGTNMLLNSLTAGYFYSTLTYRITKEMVDTTADSSQAVVNVVSETLANAMIEAQCDDDIIWHTDGTGVLTNASSAIAAGPPATMTFAGATDTIGISRLREGMTVDVWDTGLTTKRVAATGAPLVIVSIDYDAKKVTFDQGITSLTSTDKIVWRSVDIHGPSTPTSFSSAWPQTGIAAGLGGDSFRHGMPYINDYTASNYYLSKQRSAIPQLIPTRVNGGGNPLEWDMGHQMIAKMIQRWDNDAWRNLTGVAAVVQKFQVWNLGIAISTRFVQGENFAGTVDASPTNRGYTETFDFCGITCYLSKRQDKARIDFVNFNKLGRAQLFDTDYYRNPLDNRYVFEARSTSDGSVLMAVDFAIIQAFDYVSFNPGMNAVIDNLAVGAAYL
jgi:hypothetical protein